MSFYEKRITVRLSDTIIAEMFSQMDPLEMDNKTDYIRSAVVFFNRMHKVGCYDKFNRYLKKKEKENSNDRILEWSKKVT